MERLDHVLIQVDDLAESVNQFRLAGFRVYYGSEPNRAYNAMIYFQDNSFIELVDISKFPLILIFLAKSRLLNLLGGFYKRVGSYARSRNRYLDYAIYSKTINVDYERAKKNASRLHHLSRIDVLGERLEWKLFALKAPELPFVMSDYLPYKYPEETATNHKNNVLGIYKISIKTARDLAKMKEDIINLFDTSVDCLELTNQQLAIRTENTIIQYHSSTVDEIVGIELKNSKHESLSLVEKYGIVCNY